MNKVIEFYRKYLKRWVKSLAAAVGGALVGLLMNWYYGTTPIPTTWPELRNVLISALIPAVLTVLSPANKITQKQLDNDPNVIGGVVETPPAATPPTVGQVVVPVVPDVGVPNVDYTNPFPEPRI